jgi:CBS domain-containing protein/anti-sigma regulatory factor (Ser/Thr protein kinase)
MTDQYAIEVTKLQELVYELTIDEVMKHDVITVTPKTSMRDFKELLRLKRFSGVPVVDGDRLVGIVSLEDLIKALEKGEMDTTVGEEMTRDVQTLFADESVVQAVNRMARFGFGRFPVVDRAGHLVGILTRGDIIRGMLRRLELNYREEEIQRYRASHIFEDIVSDRTSLILRYKVKVGDFSRGGAASSKIKRAIERLGGSPAISRRVGVAAYEAEMNLIIHTSAGGEMVVEIQPDRVHIVATDTGPGIDDVEQAMRPGFSTAPEWIREMGFGAGMGLLNIQRCADEMKLESKVGVGTRLDTWFRIPSPPATSANGYEKEDDLL